ncbi:hypothetical protein J1605_001437 [Eschrichtius robustus]|uniref:guanylate cyclase n=1 Tax=Eschrichtius robustus TaxID=9764 RepID=A0AB34I1B6_ESCRO|nr:hypothetical protein J1605_001437 [Eschrichtius robustus]
MVMTVTALPSVAAQLAVNQANQDSSLALGSQLTSVVLPTGCDTSSALATFLAHKNTVAVFVGPVNPSYCPAAALLAQGWGKTLFSWVCGVPEGGGVLVPTLPSAAHVLLSVMRHFGWAHVAIVSSHQDIWLATARQVAMTLRAYGLPVGLVTSLGPREQGTTEVLKQLCNVDGLKIAVLCTRLALLGGSEQPALLSRAGAQGLADGRLAFLPYDTLLFTLPYCNRSYLAPGDGRHLQEACGAVLSAWSPASDARTAKLPGPQRGGCPPGAGAGRSVQTFAGPGARGHGQGEWVWLKKFEAGTAPELRPSCLSLLRNMRELRHENIATFLDFFVAPGVSALVLEHCARGSLEDLLRNEDLRLDWTFKAFLVLDMSRGVWYLHHRHFPHGRLKSRNCVVAGRFVLRVTDHGYAELLDAQRAPRPGQPRKSCCGRLRSCCGGPGNPGGAPSEETPSASSCRGIPGPPLPTSPPGDLSPTARPVLVAEIIRKVVSPPPLCRPLVSPDHGPPECIQLMEQCWEEASEDRPNLDQICTQFKSINQGKKTSVADSVLRMLEKYSQNLEDLIQEWTEELGLERQKIERLLSQMLLPSVAEALKMGATVEPEYFDRVTIYFSDTVGFTTISALSEPIEVVGLLNDLYTLFDAVLGNHDVYKDPTFLPQPVV